MISMATLKEARLKAGLTMARVTAKAGVSRPTVEKAEKGQEGITMVNAIRIVNALNELAGTHYTVEQLGILTYTR